MIIYKWAYLLFKRHKLWLKLYNVKSYLVLWRFWMLLSRLFVVSDLWHLQLLFINKWCITIYTDSVQPTSWLSSFFKVGLTFLLMSCMRSGEEVYPRHFYKYPVQDFALPCCTPNKACEVGWHNEEGNVEIYTDFHEGHGLVLLCLVCSWCHSCSLSQQLK